MAASGPAPCPGGDGPRRRLRNAAWALLALLSAAQAGSALAQEVTVVALGDSLTAGYGLGSAEGFVPRLQAWLDERGAEVTVVNAGVSGDTTAGGLSRIDWALAPEIDAMILALGGNDYLRGTDPAVSRENLDGILAVAEERGIETLVVGIRAGPGYGPDFQRDFDAMYVDLAEQYGALFERDWFEGLRPAEGTSLAEALARGMQADGIHPNAAGVDLIVERLGPRVLELAREARAGS